MGSCALLWVYVWLPARKANLIPHVETRSQGLEIRNAPTARPRRSFEGFVGLLPRWRLYHPLHIVSRANHRNRPGNPKAPSHYNGLLVQTGCSLRFTVELALQLLPVLWPSSFWVDIRRCTKLCRRAIRLRIPMLVFKESRHIDAGLSFAVAAMPFCLNAADNFPGLASPHPKKESSVCLTSTVERHSSGGATEVLVSSRRLLTGTANCAVGALSGAGFSSSGIQIPYLYLLDSTLPFG